MHYPILIRKNDSKYVIIQLQNQVSTNAMMGFKATIAINCS